MRRRNPGQAMTAARRIVRDHYGLARPATAEEARAEARNIARRQRDGLGLDDSLERLAARLAPYMEALQE
jgi:hypothetical protein